MMDEPKNDNRREKESEQESVTGSGYSYDEDQGRTDKSIPLDHANEGDIVELPDLGEEADPK